MSLAAVEGVLVRVLANAQLPELDAPTLTFLAQLVDEEVVFLTEAPGCMTGAQLLVLLSEKLESTLVDYELARTEEEGRSLCAHMVHALKEARLIELAEGGEGSNDSSAAILNAPLPRLSAPVSISALHQAQAAAAEAGPIVTMASIQRAGQRWSADEERVLFQSLADSKRSHADAEEEDEVVQEGGCEMCAREMPLTRHHLIPRRVHKMAPYCRLSKEELNTCALICRPCHSAVHSFEDEKTLAARFNTVPLLMADERVQRFVAYIAKQRVNRTQAENDAGAKGMRYAK